MDVDQPKKMSTQKRAWYVMHKVMSHTRPLPKKVMSHIIFLILLLKRTKKKRKERGREQTNINGVALIENPYVKCWVKYIKDLTTSTRTNSKGGWTRHVPPTQNHA